MCKERCFVCYLYLFFCKFTKKKVNLNPSKINQYKSKNIEDEVQSLSFTPKCFSDVLSLTQGFDINVIKYL